MTDEERERYCDAAESLDVAADAQWEWAAKLRAQAHIADVEACKLKGTADRFRRKAAKLATPTYTTSASETPA